MTDPAKLLVVDDDPAVVAFLVEELGLAYATTGETSPRAALDRVLAEDFDLVITDLEMPELRGPELLTEILDRKPGQLVLMITAFGSIEVAVQAVRAGACDFITKPFKLPALRFAIDRALRTRTMRREIVRLRRELGDDRGNLVAVSPPMHKVLDLARRASRASAAVLITGESGTGKGAVARWIHDHGGRASGPFVHVNCAALPSGLVEAELFGVRRGAFTDARESRDGLFAEASGGTIFLDEIAEMPVEIQSKLLAVLESSRVRPVGGGEVAIDARVIAATNRPIDAAVAAHEFRLDLYFRLSVIRIEMPPLRDRPDDVPALVSALLARVSHDRERPIGITEEAMSWLTQHAWPGNVRELANVVERAVALTDHDTIILDDVRSVDAPAPADVTGAALASAARRHLPLAEVERSYIRQVLDASDGNVSRAARILGIDRRTLYRKLA